MTSLDALAQTVWDTSREKKVAPKTVVDALIEDKKMKLSDRPSVLGRVGNIKIRLEKEKKAEKEKAELKKKLQEEEEETRKRAEEEAAKKIIEAKAGEEPKTIVTATPPEPVKTMPQGQLMLVDRVKEVTEKTIYPEFDVIAEKFFVDTYRKALFEAWRDSVGYEGNLGSFLVDSFDEFMKLRGVHMELVISRKVMPKP